MFRSDEIVFEASGHKYYLQDDPGFKFKFSGSKIANIIFSDKFDGEMISNRLCSNSPKYHGWNPENLQAHWNHAAIMGTTIHQEIENYLLGKGTLIEPKAKVLKPFLDDLMANKNLELYPELVIFSKEKSFSGMVDLVTRDRVTGEINIYDWKSNKKMDMKPYRASDVADWKGTKIPNCKFDKYSLQLSSYRYILEQKFMTEINEPIIVHLSETSKFKHVEEGKHIYENTYEVNLIECVDYRNVIEDILSV